MNELYLQRVRIRAPRRSPDGRTVAFSRNFGGNTYDIFTVPAAGGTPEQQPRIRYGFSENFDIRPDGNGALRVLQATTYERQPIWRSDRTPTGAFSPPVSLIASGGSALDVNPSISTDGLRIAFISTRTGGPEIRLANADGSVPQQLMDFDRRNVTIPTWTRDSRRIPSLGQVDGRDEAFLLNARSGAKPEIVRRTDASTRSPHCCRTDINCSGLRSAAARPCNSPGWDAWCIATAPMAYGSISSARMPIPGCSAFRPTKESKNGCLNR